MNSVKTLKNTELQAIYKKSKASTEDVPGWKVFIFLHQDFFWRTVISILVTFTYLMRSTEYSFKVSMEYYEYLEYLNSCIYFVDTLSATLHYSMPKTRKLRHGEKRKLFFLVIDYFTLIPFYTMYMYFVFDFSGPFGKIIVHLRLNVCLRIYHLYYLFSETRYWVYKIKIYFILTLIKIIILYVIFTHLFCCLNFINKSHALQEQCLKDSISCIIEGELYILALFCQTQISETNFYPMTVENAFDTITFFFGFYFTYGCTLPLLFFTFFNYGLEYLNFSNKYNQLKMILRNWTSNKAVENKIIDYYELVRKYGESKNKPEIINYFPLCLQKNIFCEIYWEALRHSDLFEDLSLGCKRSLALCMTTRFILPNTTLLKMNALKYKFMYLESGLLQIMAQENDASPVLSLSDGTVLGELSIFLQLKSKAVLRTAKLCIIHFLSYKSFLKAMIYYPKEMKKINKKIKYRLKLARTIHKSKAIIHYQTSTESDKAKEKADIKWLKQQYKSIKELHMANQREILAEEKLIIRQDKQVKPTEFKTQLGYTSIFLRLLVINDEVVNKYEAVCLRTKCPWLIDPNAKFLKTWNHIVITVSFLIGVMFPIFIGWYSKVPSSLLNFSSFVIVIYIIDLGFLIFTGIKIKNTLITKFETLIFYRFTTLTFYINVIAAIPFDAIANMLLSADHEMYRSGLFFLIYFLKFYIFVKAFHVWCYEKNSKPFKTVFFKNLAFLAILTYWASMVFKLTGVECVFFTCSQNDWYRVFERAMGPQYKDYASVFLVIFLVFNLSQTIFTSDSKISILIYIVALFIFRINFLVWRAEIFSAFVLERFHLVKYNRLSQLVADFVSDRQVKGRITKRVINTLLFQWQFDKGNYISEENRILDNLPRYVLDQLDQATIYETIHKCKLFKMENESLKKDLLKFCHRLTLPVNSILTTFGTQSMTLYIIHKGYVQMNSFLENDKIHNIATPFYKKSGTIFPILIAFNQYPSVLNVRTITDCELLVLRLEDFLSTLIKHNIFKDFVDAVKTTDLNTLANASPGLSIVDANNVKIPEKKLNLFKKFKLIDTLVQYIILGRAIDSRGKRYIYWECFRLLSFAFELLAWPLIFGMLSIYEKPKKALIFFLVFLESFTWIDFFLKMKVAFYNQKGIYVTHPFRTFTHYITTTFFTDLLGTVPYFHILYLIKINKYNYHWTMFMTHMLLRITGWYKFFSLFNYISSITILTFKVEFLHFLFLIIVLLNWYINCLIYAFNSGFHFHYLNRKDPVAINYYKIVFTSLRYLARGKYSFNMLNAITMLNVISVPLVSWVSEIVLYSFYTMNFVAFYWRFSDYHYYLKSFQKFLNGEKIEDMFIKEAVDHYEHVWILHKGIDFKSVFSKFPAILHEDLMMSVYEQTWNYVSCFSKANNSFYRILSAAVVEVYLKKGSIILFEKQVNGIIYFVHEGQCYVNKKLMTLNRGTIFGNIQGEDVMKNTITAKTHVTLLKIDSGIFFKLMDNFIQTKHLFEAEIKKYEDFVAGLLEDTTEEIFYDVTIEKTNEKNAESKFEPIKKTTSAVSRDSQYHSLSESRHRKRGRMFNPFSVTSSSLHVVFFIVSILTVVLIPIFIGLRYFTAWSITVIYMLDAIWIVKIIVTLRTPVVDSKTGLLIYEGKKIFYNYLFQTGGLPCDILCVLPLEVVRIIVNLIINDKNFFCFIYFYYLLRTLRIFYIKKIFNKLKKKLAVKAPTRLFIIFMLNLFYVNTFTCISVIFKDLDGDNLKNCDYRYTIEKMTFFKTEYNCVVR